MSMVENPAWMSVRNPRSLPDRYAGVLTFDGRESQLAAGPISKMVAR
jgi:hypothetical protein